MSKILTTCTYLWVLGNLTNLAQLSQVKLLLLVLCCFVTVGSLLLICVTECGAAFTSKLEGMFKDMELSKDVMVQFKQVHLTSVCVMNFQ